MGKDDGLLLMIVVMKSEWRGKHKGRNILCRWGILVLHKGILGNIRVAIDWVGGSWIENELRNNTRTGLDMRLCLFFAGARKWL